MPNFFICLKYFNIFERKKRKKREGEMREETGKGFFFKILTQKKEIQPSQNRVTNELGAQNSGIFLKIHSKHQMSLDSWQSDA